MLKNEEVQQKYSTYVKNMKLSDMDEDQTRVSKAVKETTVEYVGKIKCSKKKWYSENC